MVQGELSVTQLPCGPIETNAFLVAEPVNRQALIIDAPPDSLDPIEAEISSQGLTPIALVITHTHWDHIGDAAAIAREIGVPVLVHEREAGRLANPGGGPVPIEGVEATGRLVDGDVIELGDRRFLVMHTPGHSPGQISLYSEPDRLLIGGDTLFPNGYGRVDIPGASAEQTVETIRRLLDLPDDVTVLPGHGASTTIGRERRWMERVASSGRLLE